MNGAVNEVLRVILGMAFFGAATAVALQAIGVPIGPGELVGIFAVDASLAAMIAMLLPLRRASDAFVVAGVAGAAGMFAFFAAELVMRADAGGAVARDGLVMLLAVAPVAAGVISAGGATYLARAIRRSRTSRVAMAHELR